MFEIAGAVFSSKRKGASNTHFDIYIFSMTMIFFDDYHYNKTTFLGLNLQSLRPCAYKHLSTDYIIKAENTICVTV